MVNINWTLFWEVLNFLVLMWLLKRYLYGPVTRMLDKRSAVISGEIREAEEKNAEAEKLKNKYQQELKKTRSEAQDILEQAEASAKKRAREIVAEARKEAERVKKKKAQEIEEARREALLELKNEVASLSLLIAGKIIQESIDQKKHEQLINRYLDELGRERIGGSDG